MADASRILVVEDEPAQRTLLVEYLTRQGFQVTGQSDGAALRRALLREEPDLVLLDLGLPGEDGHSLAKYLREQHPRVAVIMVTAAGSTVDRILGLESGADDYLPKPFEPRELLARIRSVLRRAVPVAPQLSGPKVQIGRRILDLEQRILLDASGVEERLTASEFELLKLFAENPNKPLNREWLLEATSHREAEAFDRAIDLRVTRLRRKIEHNPAHPEAIRTVRGVGYMFVPAA
jgi:two-component system phosphate regulon response regulator OmpR